MRSLFRRLASWAADVMGSHVAFAAGVVIVLAWLGAGPYFHYSDTWQLVINTGTTIITFLMVFLIQSTQNRDTRAIQLKLDELLRAVRAARNELVSLEDLPDEDLNKLREEFALLAAKSQDKLLKKDPESE
ncbi:MAG TPA: low affinity iron permease family protein [Bryobacteraceae bacterium]|nr:low affinity iron permease family protein [Bryobacteraceae bacterium]